MESSFQGLCLGETQNVNQIQCILEGNGVGVPGSCLSSLPLAIPTRSVEHALTATDSSSVQVKRTKGVWFRIMALVRFAGFKCQSPLKGMRCAF